MKFFFEMQLGVALIFGAAVLAVTFSFLVYLAFRFGRPVVIEAEVDVGENTTRLKLDASQDRATEIDQAPSIGTVDTKKLATPTQAEANEENRSV